MIKKREDLQVAHSSEVITPSIEPDLDPVPMVTAPVLPEHDYSVASDVTIASLLQKLAVSEQKLAESEQKNAVLESKCAMLEAKNSKIEKENAELKGTKSRLRLFNKALTKQNLNLKKTNKDYR